MGKPLYKSLYVIAGKREDGTYGLMRTAADTVYCFDTPEEANRNGTRFFGEIILDIGLLVDPKIKRCKGKYRNQIDVSKRLKRENLEIRLHSK